MLVARKVECRCQTKDDAGGDTNRRGVKDHAIVDGEIQPVRWLRGLYGRVEDADGVRGEYQADSAAETREHDAFNQQLSDDAPTSGTERVTHGDLAAAVHCARQEEVRDVRTRD